MRKSEPVTAQLARTRSQSAANTKPVFTTSAHQQACMRRTGSETLRLMKRLAAATPASRSPSGSAPSAVSAASSSEVAPASLSASAAPGARAGLGAGATLRGAGTWHASAAGSATPGVREGVRARAVRGARAPRPAGVRARVSALGLAGKAAAAGGLAVALRLRALALAPPDAR